MSADKEQYSLTEWNTPLRSSDNEQWQCPQGDLETYRAEIISQLGTRASEASFLVFSGGYPYIDALQQSDSFRDFQIPSTNTYVAARHSEFSQVTNSGLASTGGRMHISPEYKYLEVVSGGPTSRVAGGRVNLLKIEESHGEVSAQLSLHSLEAGSCFHKDSAVTLDFSFTGNGTPSSLHINSRGNNQLLREGLGVDMLANGAYLQFPSSRDFLLEVEDFTKRQAILGALACQLGHTQAVPRLNLPATAAKAYQTLGSDPLDALVFHDRA